MNIWKGVGFAAAGALVGAAVWVALITVTGWGLWILAPIVGGCAGFGMMRGTKMTGGSSAGLLAAAVTVVAILGARAYVVNREVDEFLDVDSDEAFSYLLEETAISIEERGGEALDEEGDWSPEVYASAEAAWSSWTPQQQADYAASKHDDLGEATAFMTPLALLFDFGIIGTVCAALAAGTAYKTGGITLEQVVVEKGLATDGAQVAAVSARLRAGETVAPPPVTGGGLFAIPLRTEDKPVKAIKVPGYTATGATPPGEPGAKEAA